MKQMIKAHWENSLASDHAVSCAMGSSLCSVAGCNRDIPQRHLAGCLGFSAAKKNLTAIIALCYPGNKEKPNLVNNPYSWPKCILIQEGNEYGPLWKKSSSSQLSQALNIYLFLSWPQFEILYYKILLGPVRWLIVKGTYCTRWWCEFGRECS